MPEAETIDRTVCWVPWSGPGMEKMRLRNGDAGYVATSVVLGMHKGAPFRLNYKLKIGPDWCVRKAILEVSMLGDINAKLLRSDGRGHWRDDQGAPIGGLDGCFDIDISATPFTNTLPIRRLRLRPGDSAEIGVLYVAAPLLQTRAVKQRYTCLRADGAGSQYVIAGQYVDEGMMRDFKLELSTDRDGLVSDYPDLFRRVFPS